MNILHINSYYVASEFYKNMYESKIFSSDDVLVYVHKYKNTYNDFSRKNTIVSSPYSSLLKPFFFLRHKLIYDDILKKIDIKKIQIIHAHTLFTNGYQAYKLNKKFDIPYIVAVRNTDINYFFKKMFWLRNTGIKILNNAQKIIFISPVHRSNLFDNYIPKKLKEELLKKSLIIPNGLDDFWIKNKYSKFNLDKKNIKLLYVGIIDENKNVLGTCDAINKLINSGYKIQFDIVGKVVDNRIYEKVKKYEFVKYHNPQEFDRLINYYRDSNIFIMPSYTETFGITYLEALSQGIPIIYSMNQGVDGFFKNGYVGYSVKSDDIDSIANAIINTINNYKLLIKNCNKVIEDFNWDKINEKYVNIYKDVVNKNEKESKV